MNITELVNKHCPTEDIGTDKYFIAVLRDIFTPGLLIEQKPKLPDKHYKALVKFLKVVENYRTGNYEGSIVLELTNKNLFESRRVLIEISEDSIELSLDSEFKNNNEPHSLTICTIDLIAGEVSDKYLKQLLLFHKYLKAGFKSNFTIEFDSTVKILNSRSIDKRKELYDQEIQRIADDILEKIKSSAKSWEMPWHTGLPEAWNPITGKYYSGKNLIRLWYACKSKNYRYNRWATFAQWRKKNAKVKRGEKGTLIRVLIPVKKKGDKQQNNDKKIQLEFDFDPIEAKKDDQITGFIERYFLLFNADQVINYDPDQRSMFDGGHQSENEDEVDIFIKRTKARVKHGGNRAYYTLGTDEITMPLMSQFKDDGTSLVKYKYYSTLLHELIHWTGHKNRCKRQLTGHFGSKEYAFEELIAELGGAILANRFSQKVYPRDSHAQYINSWLSVLEKDFSYFFEALNHARYAVYWLYEITKIQPFDLKKMPPLLMNEERLKGWANNISG